MVTITNIFVAIIIVVVVFITEALCLMLYNL